ncbi:putative membrane protein [Brevundimonas bullata]|uniref:Putative membrane protein n=1 Tax=Brevundimonas bullata TaxID=13160 RepID=A0A7W7ISG8_9CAUL|nr:SdpI family protein [Brevundimonas bullata]MBB4799733.1 putative membrane protein [Brevundimonas bullata]MBB6384645.1 putative membrane protein [Brevundimonas bullata]
MMKNPTLADTAAAIVSLLILTGAVWIAIYGPETPIPVHFDAAGQANRYGSRYEVAAVLAGLALLNLLVAWMTGRQAASVADPVRRKGLQRGQWLSVLIMGAVAAFIAWASLGPAAASGVSHPGVAMAFTAFILLITGAVLGRVSPNPFIGVKTPWAYKSRLAWDRSNRLAGRLMFWLGAAGLIASPFAPQPAGMITLLAAVLIAAVWSGFESWRVWRTAPDRQPF